MIIFKRILYGFIAAVYLSHSLYCNVKVELATLSLQLRQLEEKVDPYYLRWKRDPLAVESLKKFLDPNIIKFNTVLEKKNRAAWQKFQKSVEYPALNRARTKFAAVLNKNATLLPSGPKKIEKYQILYDLLEYTLSKGDVLILDGLHHDHLEWFDNKGNARGVLDLQGRPDLVKSIESLEQQRTVKGVFTPFRSQTPEMRKKLGAQKDFGKVLANKHTITSKAVFKKYRVFQLTENIPHYPHYPAGSCNKGHMRAGDQLYLSSFNDTQSPSYGLVWADESGNIKGVITLEGNFDVMRSAKAQKWNKI